MLKNTSIAILSIALLSSCATIIDSSTQSVAIQTEPPVSAQCTATNLRGTWNAVPHSSSIEVKRSKSDLQIQCSNGVQTGTAVNASALNPWFLGNILIGGLIGGVVDGATGAMFDYEEVIKVQMQEQAGQSLPPVSSSQPVMQPPLPVYDTSTPQPDYGQPAPQPQTIQQSPNVLPPYQGMIMPPKQF